MARTAPFQRVLRDNPWSESRSRKLLDWTRTQRRRNWVPRCTVEAMDAERTWFATYTLRERRGTDPKTGARLVWTEKELCKIMQRFLDRTAASLAGQVNRRRKRDGKPIHRGDDKPLMRYVWVIERGEKATKRLHIHALIYVSQEVQKEDLRRLWRHGKITECKLVDQPARAGGYLFKYITKTGATVKASQGFGYRWFDVAKLKELPYHRTFWKWYSAQMKVRGFPIESPVKNPANYHAERRRLRSLYWRAATNRTGLHDKRDGPWKQAYPPQYYRYPEQAGERAQCYAAPVKETVQPFEPDMEMRLDGLPEDKKDFVRKLGRYPVSEASILLRQERQKLDEYRREKRKAAELLIVAKRDAEKRDARAAFRHIRNSIRKADWSFGKTKVFGPSPDDPPF